MLGFYRSLEHAQDVESHQRHTEGEESRPRIAKCFDLAGQDGLDLLKHGLDGPPPTVEVGDLYRWHLLRKIGQQGDDGFSILRSFVQVKLDSS